MALVPISKDHHAKTRVRPIASFAFAAGTTAVPIYGSELVPMSHEVPVTFLRDGKNYTPAALLGLRNGQNLLVDPQGRWIGAHVPALWRRGPFRLARAEGEAGAEARMILCLEDTSDLISETDGHPLFDEHGAPAPMISTASAMLGQIERDIHVTRAICAVLDELGMFAPWHLDLSQPDGSTQRVSDLYRVDEAKIASLPADDLVRIRDAGALPLIYAHLLSLSKVSLLGRLAKIADERNQQRAAVQSGNVNLDRAFGIVEDDPFIF